MLPLFLAAAIAAQPVSSVPRSFGDWIVGCDNRRDCEAVGFADPYDPDGTPVVGVIIARKAEADAEPAAEIDTRFFELDDYSGEIVADGKTTGLKFDKAGDLIGSAAQFAEILARSKSVSLVSARGETLGTFRTSGASAALRWMDDRQKRAGTVTAIVARGPGSAAAVPPPPALPVIRRPPVSSAAPRKLTAAQIAAVRKRFDLCGDPREGAEYHRLDAAHSIAIVNCWNGPYQSDGIIVLLPEKGGYRLAPIDPPSAEDRNGPVAERSRLISPGFDPASGLLSMEYRGRGLNDCGANASWVWDGHAFRLARYTALHECRGVTARLPHWQTANDPLSHE